MMESLKPLLFAAVAAASLSLAGCTEWVRPGTDPQTRDADLASCKAYGYNRVAPNMVTYMSSEGYYEKGETKCKTRDDGTQVCKEKSGTYHDPIYSDKDLNGDARDAFIDDCMYRRGYVQQQK
ncbi:MAG: hypothetical protein GAK28_02066 [Luteibacter sp.]|uniref:hypothetical protein n=1 Tax=Luteibacter sp. TaxID=1886636 RepID=UPI00137D22B3|nr:hypothetical protein [Luteibacter sp.]KAF1007095.1 MAG: hypothetical protein GAK28_02066 [Luteibacter sp.]